METSSQQSALEQMQNSPRASQLTPIQNPQSFFAESSRENEGSLFSQVETKPQEDSEKNFLVRSDSIMSSDMKYEPCQSNLITSPYAAQPMSLDFVDVNDFLSYKNINLNDDINPSFHQNAEA